MRSQLWFEILNGNENKFIFLILDPMFKIVCASRSSHSRVTLLTWASIAIFAKGRIKNIHLVYVMRLDYVFRKKKRKETI